MASNKTAPVAEQIGDGLPSGGWLAPPGEPVPVLCCGKNVETALRTLPFIALLDNSRGLGNIKNSDADSEDTANVAATFNFAP